MSNSTGIVVRRFLGILAILFGLLWLFGFWMLPKEYDRLSVSDYFFGMFSLIPFAAGVLIYPGTAEQTKLRAHWFAIICSVFAALVVLILTIGVLRTNLHL